MMPKARWLNYLAIYTIALVICTAFSSLKGKGFTDLGLLTQEKVTTQWAYYQAKAIKSYIYQMQYDRVIISLEALPTNTPATHRELYLAKIAEYEKNIKRYDLEKKYIQREAQQLEKKRDEALERSYPFNTAVVFLQVAIVCAIIAALLDRRVVWYISLPVGLIGLLYFLNGFFLFY